MTKINRRKFLQTALNTIVASIGLIAAEMFPHQAIEKEFHQYATTWDGQTVTHYFDGQMTYQERVLDGHLSKSTIAYWPLDKKETLTFDGVNDSVEIYSA